MGKPNRRNGMIFTLIGVLMSLVCFFIYSKNVDFISNSVVISGIVERTQSSGTGDSKEYAVIVSYTDLGGNSKTANIKGSSNVQYYNNGEAIDLRYDPASPDTLVIDSFWEMWGTVLLVGPIGLIMLIVGLGMLFKSFNS